MLTGMVQSEPIVPCVSQDKHL
ncbi:hypothetical protein B4U80_06841 [Leptotrombidium deliense]|uniref:Uncharacterized protein n=1 Tax=Leptotrombidium deliense TaxID=299467 RepID=A0A443RVE1_9ACAR|nr:hypothetical protein B4U80_06841 [Leptotrombidium deliense]